MAVRYIAPTGAGNGDGTSWQNAGTLSSLNDFVATVGPGGEILLRADAGAYSVGGVNYQIGHGGAAGAPVTIRGVDGSGAAMPAMFVGLRADPWLPSLNRGGQEVFGLQSGADHLVFESMSFRNIGNGAFRIGSDIADLTVQDMVAENVQRFLENNAFGIGGASIDGLVVRNVEVHGFSRGAIRLRYDSHNILIENVFGDSQRQDGDNFAMGVHLDDTAHAVVLRHVSMLNAHDSVNSYWNGDGFATEGGVYDVLFEDTYAAGNTDGGYDLKSSDTRLVRALAEDNKRNFRFWSDSITVEDSTSLDPHLRGGIGLQSHVWVAEGAHASIFNSTLSDQDSRTLVLDVSDGFGASLSLVGTTIEQGTGSTFARFTVGSSLDIDGVHYGADPTGAVIGSDAKDSLTGTAVADDLRGAGGNDFLTGRAGPDLVSGGDGNDTVNYANSPAGVSVNLVTGLGTGADAEGDRLSGIENIRGSGANDEFAGDAGANILDGGSGNDNLKGGAGDDTLIGGTGNDYIDGGAEHDVARFIGSSSRYTIERQSNGDVVVSDKLGEYGTDYLTGVEALGFDNGTFHFNQLFPVVVIQPPPPPVFQPPPPPPLPPTPDQVYAGNDTLGGTVGSDAIKGYGGNDKLYGYSGNDQLFGGFGNDVLYGGSGKDAFVFDTKANKITNKDAIKDFRVVDDTVRLDNAIFTKVGSNGTLKASAFWSNTTGKLLLAEVGIDECQG